MALGLKDAGGVLATAVFPGSPAARAGLVAGDILQSINASPVRDRRDYLDILRNQTAGASLRLQVLREGRALRLEVVPAPFGDEEARSLMGLPAVPWGSPSSDEPIWAVSPGAPAA